ncbi:hypothetical protein BH11BAC3_BH11BAC3_02470 [soil metagenome]
MTLKNAIKFFENLVAESVDKSEIKIYQKFIQIINGLEKRNLSESDIQMIEKALATLDLNSTSKGNKKYFSKALGQFKKYLKDTFSLISKGYYTNLGIALGSAFGALAGIIFLSHFERSLGISLGISFGDIIGLLIGRSMDSQAAAAGNLL